MKLRGKTILITGGTSGIGLELARRLSALGNVVAITGRDRSKLDDANRATPELRVFESDASDPAAIAALAERVIAELPQLDVLINNAGIMRNLDLTRCDDVTRELDVMLRGPIQLTHHLLPHLVQRRDALIVNVTSGLAFIPFAISPVYSAAKAGLHAFTQCLRAQLRGRVCVVEVAPPGVETPLFRGKFEREMKSQKAMPVDVLVDKMIAGIERGKLEIRPGLANVLKLMSRLAPSFMFAQITKATAPKQLNASTLR